MRRMVKFFNINQEGKGFTHNVVQWLFKCILWHPRRHHEPVLGPHKNRTVVGEI